MTDDAYQQGGRIPSVASSAAARLALEARGASVGAAIVGAYGLGAVLTYSPEDPSLNTASNAARTICSASPGALLADISIQTLGAAAPLAFGALFAAGALRIARQQLVMTHRSQAACLQHSPAFCCSAAAAATIPTPDGWPLASGFGGMIGDGVAASFRQRPCVDARPAVPAQVLTGVALRNRRLARRRLVLPSAHSEDVRNAANVGASRRRQAQAISARNARSPTSPTKRAAKRKPPSRACTNAPPTC
jgi:hypothetical protein